MAVTHGALKQLLSYDPNTGEFRWRIKRKGVNPGDLAGSVNTKGYRNICIDRKWYGAHRLAWFYMTGELPADLMDHINGNKDDNRFSNLREASSSQNCFNRKRQSRTRSGLKGVYQRGNRWEASIMSNGKYRYLGMFLSKEAAHKAYCHAALELHGNFAHGG